MNKVVLQIIGFAMAIALIVGVIVVIAGQGHTTGQNAKNNYETIDTQISGTLSTPVN